MTVLEFIESQLEENTAVGDLARDTKSDRTGFNFETASDDAILFHLESEMSRRGLIEVFDLFKNQFHQ